MNNRCACDDNNPCIYHPINEVPENEGVPQMPVGHALSPAEVTLHVTNRLWVLRELPEFEFKGRAEELLCLFCLSRNSKEF